MAVNPKKTLQYLLAGEESRPGFTNYWGAVFLPNISSSERFWLAKVKVLFCVVAAFGVSFLMTLL